MTALSKEWVIRNVNDSLRKGKIISCENFSWRSYVFHMSIYKDRTTTPALEVKLLSSTPDADHRLVTYTLKLSNCEKRVQLMVTSKHDFGRNSIIAFPIGELLNSENVYFPGGEIAISFEMDVWNSNPTTPPLSNQESK